MSNLERQKVDEQLKRTEQVVRSTALDKPKKEDIIEVFIEKTQNLLSLVDSLPENDSLKQTVLTYLFENLSKLDEKSLTTAVSDYRMNIDKFYQEVAYRKQRTLDEAKKRERDANKKILEAKAKEILALKKRTIVENYSRFRTLEKTLDFELKAYLHSKDEPKFAKLNAERLAKIRSMQFSQAKAIKELFLLRDQYFIAAPAELDASEKFDLFSRETKLPSTLVIKDFRIVGPEGYTDENTRKVYAPGTVLPNDLNVTLDLHSTCFEGLLAKLEYNQLSAHKDAFLRTHDAKYEGSARRFFELEKLKSTQTGDILRKQTLRSADIKPENKQRLETSMRYKMNKVVKDFAKLQNDLASADTQQVYEKSREFYLTLVQEGKSGMMGLAKIIDPAIVDDGLGFLKSLWKVSNPKNRAVLELYENFLKVYEARTIQLSQDAMTKHPKILADIADISSYYSDVSGFMEATTRTFRDAQKTGEGMGEPFLATRRRMAWQLYHDPRRDKIYAKLYGKAFFDGFKVKSEDVATDFDRQMQLVWSDLSKVYKNAPEFASNVGRLCTQVMTMEGEPGTFLGYLESMRGPIIITMIACLGAVTGGFLLAPFLAKGGALAASGFLVKLAVTSTVTGVGAGLGGMIGIAAVTGRVNHMDSWDKNLKTLVQSVGLNFVAGASGAVLGRGIGALGSVIAKKSNFWGTKLTAYAKDFAKVMLTRSFSVKTGGFFSRLKHFFMNLGEETNEELLEDMFETVGHGIAADNPTIGFLCMLIPSSFRTARSVFLQSNGKFTAAPGVNVHVTEGGLSIQYENFQNLLTFLKSKGAPVQLVTALEQSHEANMDLNGISIMVKPIPVESPVRNSGNSKSDVDSREEGERVDIASTKRLAESIKDKELRKKTLQVITDLWSDTKEGLIKGVQKLDKIYQNLKASGAWQLLGKIADKIDERVHHLNDVTTAFTLVILFTGAGLAMVGGLFIYLSTRYEKARSFLKTGEHVVLRLFPGLDWTIFNTNANGKVLLRMTQPWGEVVQKEVTVRELMKSNPEIWDRIYADKSTDSSVSGKASVRSVDQVQRRHEGHFNNKLNPQERYSFSINRPVVLVLAPESPKNPQRINVTVLNDGKIVLESNGKRHVITVGNDLLFGRMDFDPSNVMVSAQHVRIINLGNGRFELEDYGSKNGTLVESTVDSSDRVDSGPNSDLARLFQWLDAQGTTYSGMPVEGIKQNIRAYIQGNGTIAPDGIPRAGDLRQKTIDILSEHQREAARARLSRSKMPYDVSNTVSQIRTTSEPEVEAAVSYWLNRQSADLSHGVIVDDVLADGFRRSNPQKFEIRFKNGTTVKLIFPSKCLSEMARIQSYVVSAEQWIQSQFGQYGVGPSQNLTIVFMDDVRGHSKRVRGHGGTNSIIMNANEIGTRDFYETYFHERTHSVLGGHNMHAHDGGVVEGIANYMGVMGATALGFSNPSIMKDSGRKGIIANEILANVRKGMTYVEAIAGYFESRHDRTDYNLNYEYGQAFVEGFIEHFHGDVGKFLQLYAALGRSEYRNPGYTVNGMYAGAMHDIGLPASDITAILHETAGKLMLKAHKGHELFDMIVSQSPSDVHAVLDQQLLATILGLDNPTLAELEASVEDAKRHVLANHKAGRASISAFCRILDVKLGEIKSSRGMDLHTQMRY